MPNPRETTRREKHEGRCIAAGLWDSTSLLLLGRWSLQVCAKQKVYWDSICPRFPDDPTTHCCHEWHLPKGRGTWALCHSVLISEGNLAGLSGPLSGALTDRDLGTDAHLRDSPCIRARMVLLLSAPSRHARAALWGCYWESGTRGSRGLERAVCFAIKGHV